MITDRMNRLFSRAYSPSATIMSQSFLGRIFGQGALNARTTRSGIEVAIQFCIWSKKGEGEKKGREERGKNKFATMAYQAWYCIWSKEKGGEERTNLRPYLVSEFVTRLKAKERYAVVANKTHTHTCG